MPVGGSIWSLCCWWANLGLPWASVESDQAFARDAVAGTNGRFSCVVPENLLLAGAASVRPDYLPSSLPTAGATVRLVPVVIFSPWGRSHFGAVPAPVKAANAVSGLRHHFGWALAKSISEERQVCRRMWGCVESARFVQICCEKGPRSAFENSGCEAGAGASAVERRGGAYSVGEFCWVCGRRRPGWRGGVCRSRQGQGVLLPS